jgi:hypothetical protein
MNAKVFDEKKESTGGEQTENRDDLRNPKVVERGRERLTGKYQHGG